MKKIFLFLLLLSFTFVNAQKYVFNTFIKYSTHYNNIEGEAITITNSNIDSYSLRIKKYESSFTAEIYDYGNLKIHTFTVTELKVEPFLKFNFNK